MLESLIMQVTGQAVVTTGWNLFDAAAGLFMIVSGIAIFLALKLRKALENSTDPSSKRILKIIDEYILPALSMGRDFIDKTKQQEQEIKQVAEILFEFMGPLADKITEKELVKLETLKEEILKLSTKSEEYDKKVRQLAELLEQIKLRTKPEDTPTIPKMAITAN